MSTQETFCINLRPEESPSKIIKIRSRFPNHHYLLRSILVQLSSHSSGTHLLLMKAISTTNWSRTLWRRWKLHSLREMKYQRDSCKVSKSWKSQRTPFQSWLTILLTTASPKCKSKELKKTSKKHNLIKVAKPKKLWLTSFKAHYSVRRMPLLLLKCSSHSLMGISINWSKILC